MIRKVKKGIALAEIFLYLLSKLYSNLTINIDIIKQNIIIILYFIIN
jgi:hypothetical protein